MAAALAWGVLSVLLSPCHLASIPLIVGFIGGQGPVSMRRALLLASLFAGGILATVAAIGLATAGAGRLLGDLGPLGGWVVAAVFLVVGLHLLDVLPLPGIGPRAPRGSRRGPLAALLIGLASGVALGPCTFAYMAPMLAVTFTVGTEDPAFGALLLALFGLGHAGVIVLAGTFAEIVQHYLNWTERSRGTVIVRRICGTLVILGGLYLIAFGV
ncbi:MAG: cytochrome C biogenesis protein [Candidatus Krumholzibacteriota bacterium]|nr:cytochrome C biogenesis protein [Candidatus Krumholzibacteriota bacterium]